MNKLPFGPLALATAAFALMGADASTSPPSPLQAFADAATTCAEATQGKDVDAAVIERHGWKPRVEPSGEPAGTAEFSRPDARFWILKNPPLCTANWDVKSSSGRDAIFAAADGEVSKALEQAFPGRFQSLGYSTEGDRKIHRLAVGNAVVLMGGEPVCPTCDSVLLKLGALSRENVPQTSDNASPPAGTKGT